MAQARASAAQQTREEVYAALQHAAGFHCLVEAWHDCEGLKPKPKETWTVVDKKWKQRHIARSGVQQRSTIAAWDVEEVVHI